ncbi:MAG TPA: fused MFS/spermidine synthase [Desulfomonilaceae bacterium]|nr:fused MFS/spermidine synthase [Desulfomonilaceae bacterium]
MKLKHLVYILFFASGISGLMYEVVWLRMLTRITGVTIYATATVLAAFMSGLALGSFLLGRFIDGRKDALRVYAVLEFLVAWSALLVPVLFSASVPLYRYAFQVSGESVVVGTLIRGITSFVALLVPTTLMGGTLPVLTSCLVKRDGVFGKNFSILYGLNTFGAVLGVLTSGFVTIGELGEWMTIYIGMAINVLVSGIAYLTYINDRSSVPEGVVSQEASLPSTHKISPYSDKVRIAVLIAFSISGFTALAYEVLWTRQLILFLATSIYAFSGMLAIFLTGIALGSLSMNKMADRLASPLAFFGILELVVGVLSVANLYLFLPFDSAAAQVWLGWSRRTIAAFSIVFPMTFVFGMIFPIAGRCYAKSIGSTGSSVGWLYGANTVGSILGSLVAGFVLVPFVGSTKTIILLACANVALGLILLGLGPARAAVRKMVPAAIVLVFALMLAGSFGRDPFLATIEARVHRFHKVQSAAGTDLSPETEIHFNKECREGTVTAYSWKYNKGLWINGVGMTHLCTETKLMAHLPLMFAKDPTELLVICFGMGTTVKSAALYPELKITAVDLVPETFYCFQYFHPNDQQVLKQRNIHLIANDGRNHLLLSSRKYDVITVDPAPPIWSVGTVNLYSREFFQLCKDSLTPNGVMCLWFPGGMPADNFAILRTFAEVFDQISVWHGPHNWGYYFIGTLKNVSSGEFKQNVERIFNNPVMAKDLVEYDRSCATPDKLYQLRIDNAVVERFRYQGTLITDDHPFTEFFLWRR